MSRDGGADVGKAGTTIYRRSFQFGDEQDRHLLAGMI
jgi:hypothetical protein